MSYHQLSITMNLINYFALASAYHTVKAEEYKIVLFVYDNILFMLPVLLGIVSVGYSVCQTSTTATIVAMLKGSRHLLLVVLLLLQSSIVAAAVVGWLLLLIVAAVVAVLVMALFIVVVILFATVLIVGCHICC